MSQGPKRCVRQPLSLHDPYEVALHLQHASTWPAVNRKQADKETSPRTLRNVRGPIISPRVSRSRNLLGFYLQMVRTHGCDSVMLVGNVALIWSGQPPVSGGESQSQDPV